MNRVRSLAAVFLVPALLVAACGSSDDDTADDAADVATDASADDEHDTPPHSASDDDIAAQRAALALAGTDAGPQAPRDIEAGEGTNQVTFDDAPPYTDMNLCNIHFHEGAEHKGGDYTTFNGNGDGEGYGTGYLYDGDLTEAEVADYDGEVGKTEHGDLVPGDTIEIHYVYSDDPIVPGPTLGACLADADAPQPQLRVEARVYVLVSDASAADFMTLTELTEVNGVHQAVSIPTELGTPVSYAGSTTGPSYNEEPSPLKVTWSVSPEVLKVDISTVAEWLEGNKFDEDHAHPVRNLVTNPDLLAPIG
ncbi:MAG: hypothetical protein GY698_23240 [Actinomycetia bacterium]|nr:hypothetical protein [Actinomycetes bacterium]